ncbi:DNA mismatch repair protein msh6 [Dinochytrium kinnereticum]|nr:DNA mismatch repair protein msh6 [Dinochytrium kinnereticum]
MPPAGGIPQQTNGYQGPGGQPNSPAAFRPSVAPSPNPVDNASAQIAQMNISSPGPQSFRPAPSTQRSKRVYASSPAGGDPAVSPAFGGAPAASPAVSALPGAGGMPAGNHFAGAGGMPPAIRPVMSQTGMPQQGMPQQAPGAQFGGMIPQGLGMQQPPTNPQFGAQGGTGPQPGQPYGQPHPAFAQPGQPPQNYAQPAQGYAPPGQMAQNYSQPSQPGAPIHGMQPGGMAAGAPGKLNTQQYGTGRPQPQQPARPRIDPNQIPSPLAVHEADQATHDGVPYSTLSRTMPPLAATRYTAIDEVPCTDDLQKSSMLPLGLIVQPLADLDPAEAPVKVVDFGEAGPVRCRRCRGYVNPFFQFVDGGRKFICNLCSIENEVPPEYFCNLDLSGRRRDINERPELLHGAVEFVASKEYSLRPAKPVSYVFAIDVSWNSIQWGVLGKTVATLKELLFSEDLPKNAKVAIVTFDRSVHFYNLKSSLESPQMLVVSDVSDVFVPLSEGFLVDPIESKHVICNLLDSLQSLFDGNRIGEPVLGAVVQVIHMALKDCGGKAFVMQTSLPTFGPGSLKMREDARLLGSDKERTLYEPQSEFWRKLAQDCSQAGICVDLFLFPNAYIDIATVGTLSTVTGGDTYYYQNFDLGRDGIKFGEDLKRAATRTFGYEALLRIRCSNGLKATNYFGNFFMKNTTDIELAGIDSAKSIGVEFRHDGKLDEKAESSVQAALLYTTSSGERRIRVLNFSLLNTSSLGNIFRYGEMDTTLNYLAKAYVSQAASLSLKAIREQLTDKCVKILTSYRKNIASSTAPGQRALPVLDNQISHQVRSIINYILQERPRFMQLQIVRHQLDPYLEVEFANFLIEDQNHDGMTYVDYLCFVHRFGQTDKSKMLGEEDNTVMRDREQKTVQRPITAFFKRPPTKPGVGLPSSPTTPGEFRSVESAKKGLTPMIEDDRMEDLEAEKLTRRRRKPSYVVSDEEEDEAEDVDYVPSDEGDGQTEKEDGESNGMDVDVPDLSESRQRQLDPDNFRTPAKRKLEQFRSLQNNSSPTSAMSSPAFPLTSSPISSRTPKTPTDSYHRMLTPADEKRKSRAEDFKKRNDDRYSWLIDEKDSQMRSPGDVDYDPRTLHIPSSAWKKFSAFETQFWQIKAAHWDTIVFFKKGKFYELYEKDADIAHQEFDWKLTDRVNMKMCGVPENSFDTWASQFVAKGYKVARVDQEDNIIRRELTSILTTGTLVDSNLLSNDMSTYCMSITEMEPKSEEPRYCICFADTATADFKLSFFQDDVERSTFETLVHQIKPRELVVEKGTLSHRTMQIIKNNLSNPQVNFLIPGTEFWDHDRTVLELQSGGYFKKDMPSEISALIECKDSLTALGGMISYLRTLKLDKELVSIGNFIKYDPIGDAGTLVLDGKTLANLEVFENASDGTETGSLFKLLNHCLFSCGKRLLKRWICHPLKSVKEINARLDAVDDLFKYSRLRDSLAACLRSLPDMERIISRVHAGNCRVKDFIAVLKGFKDIFETIDEAKTCIADLQSSILIEILSTGFPSALAEQLEYFDSAFDHKESMLQGDIEINEGYDEIFDEANKVVEDIEAEFEEYRAEQEKALKTKILYKDVGKDLFQLEMPSKVNVPRDWKLMSKTKTVNRYHTSKIDFLTRKYLEGKEIRENSRKEVRSRLYQKFDGSYAGWLSIIRNMSILDCLCSLAFCRLSLGSPVCRPKFHEGSERMLVFEELRHPCIITDPGKDFIPNDVSLGGTNANIILLTGPNMGGKSTLLRQVELSETSRILKEATKNSLVVLDELGRGTSTFDGYAIAFSVLRHLLTDTRCLGLFSTHYGMLTSEFMENKLATGACPKSFGMNVASMAGIPSDIIDCADDVASNFERSLRLNNVRDVRYV